MRNTTFPCLIVIFSIWLSLFAPFISAQNTDVKGLQFKISEATGFSETPQIKPPIKVEDLSKAEADEILRRLPKMPVDTEEIADFKMRGDSLKPPKTGEIIPLKFSDDVTNEVPDLPKTTTENLRVERFSPTGDISLVSDMSVTFSQPMVAVSTQTAASETVPVKISPEINGRWRWLGTNTLILDAETRFPMATEFTATIPKGTRSAIGGVLQNDVSWTFRTPPPKVETFTPKNEREGIFPDYAIMAAKFNQDINGDEILPKIKVFADGKQMPIRLITYEVDNSYSAYQELGQEVTPKNWLAFRTSELLPRNAEVKVIFEKGLPSAEGSLRSEKEQSFTFKTITPFRLDKLYCGYKQNVEDCDPSDDFRLQFNHSRYPGKLDKSMIKIEPPIKDAEIESDGSGGIIYIRGRKKPNTTYKITISGKMIDFYKQPLGKDATAIFKVGTEDAILTGDGEDFVTLDPNGKLQYSIYTRNQESFKVRLYSVTTDDYPKFRGMMYQFRNSRQIAPTPDFGKLIFDKTITVKTEPDAYEETKIDLKEAIPNKFGHALIIAEPTVKSEKYNPQNFPFATWIQSTNIGIDAFIDYEKLVAFATDLKTARPLSNKPISLNYGNTVFKDSVTNETGIAEFMFADATARGFLLAKNGDDSAILSENQPYAALVTSWRKLGPFETLRWFIFDDRKMYRPNEEVSIKGYLRKMTWGKFTDIAEIGDRVKTVRYVWRDPRGNELGKGTVKLNAFGAFDFKLNLPDNINLGNQRLEFWTEQNNGYPEFQHTFQVQEFRRPEFEVTTKAENAAPFFVGEKVTVSAVAKYYTGGFLKNSETKWNVTSRMANYTPPNRDDFTFGTFIPWWRHTNLPASSIGSQKFEGTTDENGDHRIELDLISANPARPYTVEAQAEIADVNRQIIASKTSLLVHPSTLYVGIRTPKNFVKPKEKLTVETITTDLDGKAIAGRNVSIIAELYNWKDLGSRWDKVLVDTQKCQITSTETVASCEIFAKQGGIFTIKASVLDDRERKNESELTVWVAGGSYEVSDQIEEENVELIPDKKDYSPNDTAEILVNAPFFPAEGVMTLERSGIVKTVRFTMNESSKVLQIPLEERYLPNIHVKIDLVGTKQRNLYNDKRDAKLPKRPAFASGEVNLNISTATRELNVTAEPTDKTLEPGGETKINVDVKDANGNASANTEVAVIAVDEGVLALADYKITNPLEAFYTQIDGAVTNYHSRDNILLSYPDDIGFGFGNGSGDGNGRGNSLDGVNKSKANYSLADIGGAILQNQSSNLPDQIKVRKNFDALAIFSPSVVTDETGKATVDLKLPDNLTRYRITAVAVTKSKQFGKSESNVTAKTSLQVRPSAPRFMNYGDKAELPVVLQNMTDSPMTVNVAMRSQNATLPNGNGKKVTIPANERAEIRFPVSTAKAGIARFQVGAVSGEFTDAAEFAFPVYTPATTEAFATYGTTEKNGAIVQSIATPKNVFADYGGLEVTTSSTQLQELTDAFIYLQSYPFDCTEQISSRILSVAALRDVLAAFDAKDMPSKEKIEARMKYDIDRLQNLQHGDGGWSFWRNNDESIPFVSVHVAHAIARAKAKGYEVPERLVSMSLNYLKNIESKYPKEYSEESRWAISAYALYTRDLLGDKDTAKAKKLLQDVGLEKLSLETDGWLLSVFADDENSVNEVETIKQHLLNRVTETAGNAHFVTNYKDGEYVLLSSKRRADGVILEALLKVQNAKFKIQNSELETLIPKIVRGLLAHRTKGRWYNTQENAFILLALDKYFQTYEKTTPNFAAKIWLGKSYAGEQKFVGRSVDSNQLNVPMKYLQEQEEATQNLIFDKQGEGRLYYRVGLKYAPKDLNVKSADYGFAVSRTYEALDNVEDVKQNADGSWTIKSGSRVRVNIQMIAPTRRYHVALVDNLPAGIEIINPELAISGNNNYLEYSTELRRRSFWFNHQNLRDNRAEAFTSLLKEGIWNYSYLTRATTPGNFVVPPVKAEEMYSPETFGRGKTDYVTIK